MEVRDWFFSGELLCKLGIYVNKIPGTGGNLVAPRCASSSFAISGDIEHKYIGGIEARWILTY